MRHSSVLLVAGALLFLSCGASVAGGFADGGGGEAAAADDAGTRDAGVVTDGGGATSLTGPYVCAGVSTPCQSGELCVRHPSGVAGGGPDDVRCQAAPMSCDDLRDCDFQACSRASSPSCAQRACGYWPPARVRGRSVDCMGG